MTDGRFAKVPISFIQNHTLSHHARMVYIFLLSYRDFGDPALPVFVSTTTLSQGLGISLTLTKRCLKELAQAGCIRREKRYQKTTLTYLLL